MGTRAPDLGKGLFGGDDHATTLEDIEGFRRALDAAGVKNEIVVFEGAPHSFFDRNYAQYREECNEARRRMLQFIHDLS